MKIIGRRTREIPDYFRWPISFLRTLVELREIANLGRYRFIRGRVTYTLFSLLTYRCVRIRQRTWSPSVRFRNAFIVSQKKTPERAKTCFDDGFFFFCFVLRTSGRTEDIEFVLSLVRNWAMSSPCVYMQTHYVLVPHRGRLLRASKMSWKYLKTRTKSVLNQPPKWVLIYVFIFIGRDNNSEEL